MVWKRQNFQSYKFWYANQYHTNKKNLEQINTEKVSLSLSINLYFFRLLKKHEWALQIGLGFVFFPFKINFQYFLPQNIKHTNSHFSWMFYIRFPSNRKGNMVGIVKYFAKVNVLWTSVSIILFTEVVKLIVGVLQSGTI